MAVTDDLEFVTLTDDVITPLINYVEIEAECDKTGTAGNGWEVGRIKTLKSSLNTDLTVEVANIDVSSGGFRRRAYPAPDRSRSNISCEDDKPVRQLRNVLAALRPDPDRT